MKIKYLIITITSLALLFSACNDLDTLPQGNDVTSKQKEETYELNPERAEAGVNAIFAQFNQYMPNESALNAERHNDFGYPSIMLFTDANGMDVVSEDNGYNWTGNSLDFSDRVYTSNESQIVWNNLYSMIFTANSVVAANDRASEDPTINFYLGQGLAARAFSYFNLVQLYQFNYVGNQSQPAVPIVTDENSVELADLGGAPRSTVQEVYDLIVADLNDAINYLTIAEEAEVLRKDKRYINLAVAYGLRARVHLTMQKWTEASSDADNAILYSDAEPSEQEDARGPAFMSSSEDNWMWGIIISETDRVVTSGIVNWISHMGSLNYGYANFSGGKQINLSLYETISDTDVRKGWWLDQFGESKDLSKEEQETANSYGYKPYTQVKFAPYNNVMENSTNANDIPLMRIEEMYLIKAEADAMSGGGNSTLVDFVKTYRDSSYSFSSTNPADIQEEVYRQRRIELWGEGLNWYDVMRLNKSVDRRGGGFPNATMVFNIPSGDPILLWRIPQKEIIANPSLSEGDNNPTAPTPNPVADN